MAIYLIHAFSHSGQSQAHVAPVGCGDGAMAAWQAAAVIDDLDQQRTVLLNELDAGAAAARMAQNVAEGLLDDAERAQFDVAREAPDLGGDVEINLSNAMRLQAGDVHAQSRRQAHFLEQRRMQQDG